MNPVASAPARPAVPVAGKRTAPAEEGASASRSGRNPLRAFLGIPLFWKLLVANGLMVFVGAGVAAVLAVRYVGDGMVGGEIEAALIGGLLGAGVTVVLNGVLVTLALSPLRQVEETAQKVARGDVGARIPSSELADADLRHLVEVFNHMLDSLDRSRRRQKELALRVLSAEEAERRRIAWELYNGAAQTLASLLLQIRVATGRGSQDGTVSQELIQSMRGEILDALESVQRLARRLRPPELDDLGLLPAIEAHARNVGELAGLRVSVGADGSLPSMPPAAVLALYRIVEEAIRNAVRHAEASRVDVHFRQGSGSLELEISDDGVGFETNPVMSGPTSGLLGIQERAEYLGGSLEMQSAPEAGTVVRVRVPLNGNGEAGGPIAAFGESRAPATVPDAAG